MEDTKTINLFNSKINEIENEDNINIKYKNIAKLHKMIEKDEKKLEKYNKKLDNIEPTKYDDYELDDIISKFEESKNLDKKIKYYHAISNKIDNLIDKISI